MILFIVHYAHIAPLISSVQNFPVGEDMAQRRIYVKKLESSYFFFMWTIGE